MSILEILPSPPAENIGWPWGDHNIPVVKYSTNGFPWPKISIVTPSYNQAQFLEETIRSVLLQGYPNLEYIIIDGGSTDGSVEIIKKYEPWLMYWVSEIDRGQPHAINKGFEKSTGEIMAWINSDDYYTPWAFKIVVETFQRIETEWVAGRCYIIEMDGSINLGRSEPVQSIENWLVYCQYTQPNVFWKRTLWEKSKKLDEKLQFSFDYELWLQFAYYQPFAYWIDDHFAYFRMHPNSKTVSNRKQFEVENRLIFKRHKRLIKNCKQKLKVDYLRRTSKANYYLSLFDRSKSLLINFICALFYAPWYVFRPHFYKRMKSLFF